MKQLHTNPTMQRMGRGSQNKSTLALQCSTRTPEAERSAHKPFNAEGRLWSQDKGTQAPWSKGQARGAKTGAHKPRNTEGGPWELRQVHISPVTQRLGSGGWGKPTQVSMMQKAQEKIHTSPYLASFGQQCRAGQGNDPRDKQESGDTEDILREPAEIDTS